MAVKQLQKYVCRLIVPRQIMPIINHCWRKMVDNWGGGIQWGSGTPATGLRVGERDYLACHSHTCTIQSQDNSSESGMNKNEGEWKLFKILMQVWMVSRWGWEIRVTAGGILALKKLGQKTGSFLFLCPSFSRNDAETNILEQNSFLTALLSPLLWINKLFWIDAGHLHLPEQDG